MQNPCPYYRVGSAQPAPSMRPRAPRPLAQIAFLALSALATAVLPAAWATSNPTNHQENTTVMAQASRWLAAQLQLPADKVTVLAPDPRLRMPQCATAVQFDTPFSNANTVRARCDNPQWQLFLRAQWPDSTANPAGEPAAQAVRPVVSATGSANLHPADGGRTSAPPRRAWALTRGVARGGLLSPASVEATQVPAREADSLLITDAQALDQMEAVRDLPAGTPLRQTDIRPAVLVRQGQSVTMTVGQGTGFTVTVRLEALQDGRFGDRVTLRNTESGRTITGVVIGFNSVKGA